MIFNKFLELQCLRLEQSHDRVTEQERMRLQNQAAVLDVSEAPWECRRLVRGFLVRGALVRSHACDLSFPTSVHSLPSLGRLYFPKVVPPS